MLQQPSAHPTTARSPSGERRPAARLRGERWRAHEHYGREKKTRRRHDRMLPTRTPLQPDQSPGRLNGHGPVTQALSRLAASDTQGASRMPRSAPVRAQSGQSASLRQHASSRSAKRMRSSPWNRRNPRSNDAKRCPPAIANAARYASVQKPADDPGRTQEPASCCSMPAGSPSTLTCSCATMVRMAFQACAWSMRLGPITRSLDSNRNRPSCVSLQNATCCRSGITIVRHHRLAAP